MVDNEDCVAACDVEETCGEDRMSEKGRKISKTSLVPVSPGKRHSHIPVPSRTRGETGKKATTLEKVSPKDCRSRIARKCPPTQQRRIGATVSKPKPNTGYPPDGRSRSSTSRSINSGKDKRTESNEQCLFPKISSARKNSTENSLNYTKSYTTITLSSPRAEESDTTPDSPCNHRKRSESASDGKASFRCNYDVNQKEETSNTQIEMLSLRFKDSESELFSTVAGSSFSSARRTISSPRLEILRTPQTTIRTLSGDELVFSSSMEFDDLECDLLPTENEETISQLLKATEDESFVKTYGGIQATEEDANEYDSEEATDDEAPEEQKSEKVMDSSKTDPEELMTDVDYRQFVYHPTILRRQMEAESQSGSRSRSKSIEDNSSFRLGDTQQENGLFIGKKGFKKNLSQTFVSDRDVNITPLRNWSEKAARNEEEQTMYSNLHLVQNSDYVLKEMKRERSKRERITGAVLRLTAKFIHLLAILNLWPGDNCQLLTSHSLRYGR